MNGAMWTETSRLIIFRSFGCQYDHWYDSTGDTGSEVDADMRWGAQSEMVEIVPMPTLIILMTLLSLGCKMQEFHLA